MHIAVTAAPRQDHFVALLDRHKPILYKVASAYCARREDRGDLIQDIVVELWRAFPRFDGRASFATFMHRIAVNVAISHFRGESRRIRDALPIEDLAFDLAAADRVMDNAGDDLVALQQAIAALDDISRALVLLHLDGYDHDAIGAMLGLTPGNVGTRLHRIRQKLQRDHAETRT